MAIVTCERCVHCTTSLLGNARRCTTNAETQAWDHALQTQSAWAARFDAYWCWPTN
jgi:hypothetical protein